MPHFRDIVTREYSLCTHTFILGHNVTYMQGINKLPTF